MVMELPRDYDKSNWLAFPYSNCPEEDNLDEDTARLAHYERLARKSQEDYEFGIFRPSVSSPLSGSVNLGKPIQETSTSTYNKAEIKEPVVHSEQQVPRRTWAEVLRDIESEKAVSIRPTPAHGIFCKLPIDITDKNGDTTNAGTLVEVTRVTDDMAFMDYAGIACSKEIFTKAGINLG